MYRLINSTFDIKELIPRLSNLICHILNVEYCLIYLIDPTKKYSTCKCILNKKKRVFIDKKNKINNKIYKKIIHNANSICSKHILAVPLIAEDIIGFILVRKKMACGQFDDFDLELLTTIAGQIVTGIKNLQLYEEQQKIVLGSIKSLVMLLDTKVPQAYTHSPHFSRLVLAIAEKMHLDERDLRSLEYASMLHDAGKADIPLKILTKTKKLSSREYTIIKTHPKMGAKILRPLLAIKPAIPIITHHHEKFDGTGYPSGLKGDQIPLGARIMSVADAFEAMVFGRPYRQRKNIEEALSEIKKHSGTQFDPKVVEAFFRALKKNHLKKYLHLY